MSKLFYAIFFPAALISFLCNAAAFAQSPPPLTLPEGLKIVTAESRVLKIARLAEEMAVSDVKIARAALLPTINASASMTALAYQPAMVAGGSTVSTSSTEFASYSLSLEQLLFDFRGSLSRYDASRMMLEAQKHDTARIRDAIALTALAETNHIRSIYDCRRAEAALHYAVGRNLADIYRQQDASGGRP